MSIESVKPSSHLNLCRPLLLLPPIPPSIRVFSNESTFRIRWPKYWSFSFSISPSKEHPGLISFRMDWFYFLLNKIDFVYLYKSLEVKSLAYGFVVFSFMCIKKKASRTFSKVVVMFPGSATKVEHFRIPIHLPAFYLFILSAFLTLTAMVGIVIANCSFNL